ncbi:AAA family ATPase [Trichocoleus sp. FACHB-591]|uniref:AAA family ATPase n=1 Tax=Trichocoleus sp. FACHB-591 TaxID=2692872 RepID=UPI00168743EA|nr:AAA family ATPase [Trichocoleus sp. FACHB-591]MBD2095253.1 AAA family ATPase [Trichocoleus sp. FACHB-591]
MATRYFDHQDGQTTSTNLQSQGLLGAGWRPLNRELDWQFLWHLAMHDSAELSKKTVDIASAIADTLGRTNYSGWANLLSVFSSGTRYELDEFWSYITPEPPSPDYRHVAPLTVETPVLQQVSRTNIPIDYVLNRLQELTILKVLELLGKPALITQYYFDRYFYLPIEKFISWDRVDTIDTVNAYWPQQDIWLQIQNIGPGRRRLTLLARELNSLINKATYNLAVMLSGYQSRVGQIQSQYAIRSFSADVQDFSDRVQQAVFDQSQLAVLVHGEPGTGKTAWTQAIAKEVLMPLGYVIFILDHDAVENFVPPTYLERICLIINEADNLAQNRANVAAQSSNKTEHILSLLDGTLHQSVLEEGRIQTQQRFVVLMTCNTMERLDPALLRKGRVDLIHEFVHKFV